MKTKFSFMLNELIHDRELTISMLSKQTGIPRTSINNWIFQNRSPQIDALAILSDFFKVSVDYLLGLEDEFGNKIKL